MLRLTSGLAGRIVRILQFVVMALVLAADPALAQDVRGRVLDPQDKAVALADVLILQGTGVVTTAKTSVEGRFGPIALPAGEYELLVAAPGWRSASQKFTISGTTSTTADVKLAIAAVSESVVVSAAQVDQPLSRATDSVTVIERADLRALQAEIVANALRLAPGLGVVQQGGRGAVTSIFPRGGESDYTLVLVDGIPINAFGGGFDAAHLAATEVERIEVVRGPQSALYGDGAIGGIVHVVTPHGGPTRGNALFEGGGYGTTHLAAGASGSRRAWSWGANLDWLSTDGDTRERANLGRRVANDDYETVSGSGNVSWSDRADRRIRFDLLLGHNDRGNPGPYGSDPEHLYGGLDLIARSANDTTGVRASATFGSAKRFRHSLQLTATDVNSKFDSASFSAPGTVDTSKMDTNRVTGRYQLDLERNRVGVSAGWEFLFEQETNTFIKDVNAQESPVERNVSGLFVETRWPFGARAFLNAGIRFEHIARSALPAGRFGQPALDEDAMWSTNPKISGAWFMRPADSRGWTKLRFGAGTGIKPPTAFELAFTNNPGLKPERSRSFDVGVEQALVGSALVADLTWFANRYDDLIVSVGTSFSGASRYQTDNIANASAKGLELGASFRSPIGLSARVAYTFLDTEVLSVDNVPSPIAPQPYNVGDPLNRRPRNQTSAEVTWSAGRTQAFFVVNGRGKMSDIEPNFASTVYANPGYAVVAIGGSFRVGHGIDAYARVTNLFDKSYEEALGYPALGRAAMIGVRIAATR